MAEAQKPRSSIFQFLLLFLTLYIGMQFVLGQLFPSTSPQQMLPGPELTASSSYTVGNHPVVTLTNKPVSEQSFGITGWFASKWCSVQRFFTTSVGTEEKCSTKAVVYSGTSYTLPDRCPNPPLDIFIVEQPGEAGEKTIPVTSRETVTPCEAIPVLQAGEMASISLAPWKYSIFEKTGVYEVRLPVLTVSSGPGPNLGTVVPATSVRFSIVEPGMFRKTFRTFISAPFLNFLVFVASMTPGYNLGIAIIVLTLAVKILLYFPTQHALEGQKKMQMLQPKLEALKAKYTGNSKKIQEETMKLWKEHNINPFQSILPMLIQFPVLIGLFYVIRDASDFALSRHLLYSMYDNLPWAFGTSFLGLDLLRPDVFVIPILLIALQFLQMKLSFSIQKRKKKQQQNVIDVEADGKTTEKTQGASPQDMQQKMMLYGLPLMIGFFALQFPAAVSLYWGVSTIFAIGQQLIVNREHLRV